MVVMVAAGQGAMLWIGLLKQANKARVAAVPGRRATDLGTLRDPKQVRSHGWKHWLSKQGVLAGRLAEQARSLGRKIG